MQTYKDYFNHALNWLHQDIKHNTIDKKCLNMQNYQKNWNSGISILNCFQKDVKIKYFFSKMEAVQLGSMQSKRKQEF